MNRRKLPLALGRADRELLSQLEAVLRREGIHHRLVRCRVLGALIEVAELDGDREKAAMHREQMAATSKPEVH